MKVIYTVLKLVQNYNHEINTYQLKLVQNHNHEINIYQLKLVQNYNHEINIYHFKLVQNYYHEINISSPHLLVMLAGPSCSVAEKLFILYYKIVKNIA